MSFKEQVLITVSEIPSGKVATYGQIASLIGNPNTARQVGWILRGLTVDESDIPWWRVVNAQGYLSINHGHGLTEKDIQADLLRDEGVDVYKDYTLDLNKYLWRRGT